MANLSPVMLYSGLLPRSNARRIPGPYRHPPFGSAYLAPDAPWVEAFYRAYGPAPYGDPHRPTATERYGLRVGAVSAADRHYFQPDSARRRGTYPRARTIDFEDVRQIRVRCTDLAATRRPFDFKSFDNKYKYYDYTVPDPIYTEPKYMYGDAGWL